MKTPTYCENIVLPFYLRCNTALINPIYKSLRFWSLKKLRFSATIFRVFVLFNGLNGYGKRNVNDFRFILHNYLMPTESANIRKLKIIAAVTRRATFATSCWRLTEIVQCEVGCAFFATAYNGFSDNWWCLRACVDARSFRMEINKWNKLRFNLLWWRNMFKPLFVRFF